MPHLKFAGRHLLVRADLNVPLKEGRITDSTRIDRFLPGLKGFIRQGAKITLMSHLGRPKDKPDPTLSLKPVAEALQQATGIPVRRIPLEPEGNTLPHSGEIHLLENLRFHPGEKQNDPAFARKLAKHGEIYLNDAFACCHREHASLHAITHYLPSFAGPLLLEEILAIRRVLAGFQRPLTIMIGGGKTHTKIYKLYQLVEIADTLVLAGKMALPFLAVTGKNTGSYDAEEASNTLNAEAILRRAQDENCRILLPEDYRTLEPPYHAPLEDLPEDQPILDIGLESLRNISKTLKASRSMIWNGPLGKFEEEPYNSGTRYVASIASALCRQGKLSALIGGGDTQAALNECQDLDAFDYISTGGGAFLASLGGLPRNLPALNVLENLPFPPYPGNILIPKTQGEPL